jgi:excisionase family DNA binding protein
MDPGSDRSRFLIQRKFIIRAMKQKKCLTLSVTELAEILGISRTKAYVEVKSGRIRALNIPGCLRIHLGEVKRVLGTGLDEEPPPGPDEDSPDGEDGTE